MKASKKSPNQAKLETSVQSVLQQFYSDVIVPAAKEDGTDPVSLFNATVKGALGLKEQDDLDEHRSSFFTLKN